MKGKKRRIRRLPSVARKAEQALKVAVAKVIAEHRKAGYPLVIWRDGRVVRVPAHRLGR